MTLFLSAQARKGGATKTTVCVNLAAAIVEQGKTVLLIDSDGQGNATSAVGLDRRPDFYNLIANDAEFADLIREAPVEFSGERSRLFVLSTDDSQRLLESVGETNTPMRMIERMKELDGVYDLVIADTSPGATEVHVGWYYVSDYVLLPTLCETLSVDSLDDTLGFLARAADAGRKAGMKSAEVLGIVPNRYGKGVKNRQYNLGLINGRHRQYRIFDPIRDGVAWETAMSQRESIYTLTTKGDRHLAQSARDARKEFAPLVSAVLEKIEVN